MESPSVVVTGGADGVIRRWDLSGEGRQREGETAANAANDAFQRPAASASASAAVPVPVPAPVPVVPVQGVSGALAAPVRTRFLDFYFSDAIEARRVGSTGGAAAGAIVAPSTVPFAAPAPVPAPIVGKVR